MFHFKITVINNDHMWVTPQSFLFPGFKDFINKIRIMFVGQKSKLVKKFSFQDYCWDHMLVTFCGDNDLSLCGFLDLKAPERK